MSETTSFLLGVLAVVVMLVLLPHKEALFNGPTPGIDKTQKHGLDHLRQQEYELDPQGQTRIRPAPDKPWNLDQISSRLNQGSHDGNRQREGTLDIQGKGLPGVFLPPANTPAESHPTIFELLKFKSDVRGVEQNHRYSFILQRLHNTRTSSSSLSLGSTGAALNMSYIPTLAGGFASYSSSKEGQDYSQGTSIVTESEEHVINHYVSVNVSSSALELTKEGKACLEALAQAGHDAAAAWERTLETQGHRVPNIIYYGASWIKRLNGSYTQDETDGKSRKRWDAGARASGLTASGSSIAGGLTTGGREDQSEGRGDTQQEAWGNCEWRGGLDGAKNLEDFFTKASTNRQSWVIMATGTTDLKKWLSATELMADVIIATYKSLLRGPREQEQESVACALYALGLACAVAKGLTERSTACCDDQSAANLTHKLIGSEPFRFLENLPDDKITSSQIHQLSYICNALVQVSYSDATRSRNLVHSKTKWRMNSNRMLELLRFAHKIVQRCSHRQSVVDPQLATNWLRLGWAQEYRGQQAIADLLSDKPSIEDMDPTIPVLIAQHFNEAEQSLAGLVSAHTEAHCLMLTEDNQMQLRRFYVHVKAIRVLMDEHVSLEEHAPRLTRMEENMVRLFNANQEVENYVHVLRTT